jgi:hypothetical protein
MEKRANYQAKMLSQGGKLILTGKHLVFKPHRFNVRAKTITIELEDIADIPLFVLGLKLTVAPRSIRQRTHLKDSFRPSLLAL